MCDITKLMHPVGPMLFRICLLYESCSKHDSIQFVIDYDRIQADGLNTASVLSGVHEKCAHRKSMQIEEHTIAMPCPQYKVNQGYDHCKISQLLIQHVPAVLQNLKISLMYYNAQFCNGSIGSSQSK